MKKLLVSIFAILILGTLQLPAVEAAGGCVTKAEIKKVKVGMTKTKAHQIMGTSGSQTSVSKSGSYKIEMRDYKTCSPYDFGSVVIMFENGKVSSKTSMFL
jgi:hypothetical protein